MGVSVYDLVHRGLAFQGLRVQEWLLTLQCVIFQLTRHLTAHELQAEILWLKVAKALCQASTDLLGTPTL